MTIVILLLLLAAGGGPPCASAATPSVNEGPFSARFFLRQNKGHVGHIADNLDDDALDIDATDQNNDNNSPNSSSFPDIAIASYRDRYQDDVIAQPELARDDPARFSFARYQSPAAIRRALEAGKPKGNAKEHKTNKASSQQHSSQQPRHPSFRWFDDPHDGRHGYIAATRLANGHVLAESEQVAPHTTARHVLRAYLTGALQEAYNPRDVLRCTFCRKQKTTRKQKQQRSDNDSDDNDSEYDYYQQDLVLKSQRIIARETGIMKYSQTIVIDQIGPDNYNVLIRLLQEDSGNEDSHGDNGNENGNDDRNQRNNNKRVNTKTRSSSTRLRPFESLQVHVGLQQQGPHVRIYASGVMQVNRKVVPNLVVFDASGIAGAMAGKGTLWLAAHFRAQQREREQRREQRILQQQDESMDKRMQQQ